MSHLLLHPVTLNTLGNHVYFLSRESTSVPRTTTTSTSIREKNKWIKN